MPCLRLKNTYSLLLHFVVFFIVASFLVRVSLLLLSAGKAALSLAAIARIFSEGLLFDIGVALFFVIPYSIYLVILPSRLNRSAFNRYFTYAGFCMAILITCLSFFAEFTFWNEFESRFNFIAVDYLIYTYEVVSNINESYPLPLLLTGILLLTVLITLLFKKLNYFKESFNGTVHFPTRLAIAAGIILLALIYSFKIPNSLAETGKNRYQDELAKAGIFSFFSAFKNNELNYNDFYTLIGNEEAFRIVRKTLGDTGTVFQQDGLSINRTIHSGDSMIKPNVILVTIESFSADFMTHFGSTKNLTPTLDSLWNHSVVFDNMFATGTRTVRGMEALTLSIPPTPGSSIIRRNDNDNLATVGNIFQSVGYETAFIYGGDGYFDNMNQFFGSNGYHITDRGRSMIKSDHFTATRTLIPDSMVHFENAWGICDEDLYDAVIKNADENFKQRKLFHDFVMTTSNHRPFTYPGGKIDIPSGSGRDGAVKYTDYAINRFLTKIKDKPWFDNTVIIFVADHCANSAGKTDIDISKYHIPALIVNLPKQDKLVISKMCSQIDLFPTLFSLLHWNYRSNLYGKM